MTRSNKACFLWVCSHLKLKRRQHPPEATLAAEPFVKDSPVSLCPTVCPSTMIIFPLHLATHFQSAYRSPVIPYSLNLLLINSIIAFTLFPSEIKQKDTLNVSSLSWLTDFISISMQADCPRKLQTLHPLRYSKLSGRRSQTGLTSKLDLTPK